jgi:hypothetical protein
MPENSDIPHAQDRAHRIVTAFLDVVVDALQRRLDGDLMTLKAVRGQLTAQMRDEIHDVERTVRNEIRID